MNPTQSLTGLRLSKTPYELRKTLADYTHRKLGGVSFREVPSSEKDTTEYTVNFDGKPLGKLQYRGCVFMLEIGERSFEFPEPLLEAQGGFIHDGAPYGATKETEQQRTAELPAWVRESKE